MPASGALTGGPAPKLFIIKKAEKYGEKPLFSACRAQNVGI
jgi:hypothetical protein